MESKLPEEKSTQLPAEVVEEINLSAKAFAVGMYPNFPTARDRAEKILEAGATEWAQWKVKYDELKEKYDNILAADDGHSSQTENVWQSGFAAGHDAGYEKANHKVRNELQKQFIDNDVKWVKEHQELKERAERITKEHSDLNLALAAMLNGYQNLSMYQKDWFSIPKDLIDAYTKMVLEYDKRGKEVGNGD